MIDVFLCMVINRMNLLAPLRRGVVILWIVYIKYVNDGCFCQGKMLFYGEKSITRIPF